MYQLGIIMIAVQHTKRRKKPASIPTPRLSVKEFADDVLDDLFSEPHKPEAVAMTVQAVPVKPAPNVKQIQVNTETKSTQQVVSTRRRSVDGFRPRPTALSVPNRDMSQHLRRNAVVQRPARSVDGIIVSSRQTA
jgi:hypothetical protein